MGEAEWGRGVGKPGKRKTQAAGHQRGEPSVQTGGVPTRSPPRSADGGRSAMAAIRDSAKGRMHTLIPSFYQLLHSERGECVAR